jgi:hypothetical protein
MPNIKQAFNRIFGFFDGIRQINDRYKTPRLKMTPLVRLAMIFLRIYLILIMIIMMAKFISMTVFHN